MKKILCILPLIILITGCSKNINEYIKNSLIKNNNSYSISVNINGNYDSKIINDDFTITVSGKNKKLVTNTNGYFVIDNESLYCLRDTINFYPESYTKCENKSSSLIDKSDEFINALYKYTKVEKTDYGFFVNLDNIDDLKDNTLLKNYTFNNVEAKVYTKDKYIDKIEYILVDDDKEYLKVNVYITNINEEIDISKPEIKNEKTLY